MKIEKTKIDYVFSGTLMLRIVPFKSKTYYSDAYHERKKKIIIEGLEIIQNKYSEIFPQFDISTSLLYNAFTENRLGIDYKEHNRNGFKSIYADSGGLQVVTRNMQLTDELKLKVYEQQKNADYAFCFDNIPVELKEGATLDGGNRSQVGTKQFITSRFKECAYETAQNIKIQLKSLEGSDTKVYYIVQGNTYQDMIDWVKYGAEILTEEELSKLEGIAPADTCMGNGDLETCDMLYAAREILDSFPMIKKKIHLLGVGSTSRFLPVLKLIDSKFLEGIDISFDSSTNSMSMVMGNFKDETGYSAKNDKEIKEVFLKFADFYDSIFSKYVPEYNKSDFADFIIENLRFIGNIENKAMEAHPEYEIVAGVVVPFFCLWQNIGFFNVCKEQLHDQTPTPINLLSHVQSKEDYLMWRREFKSLVRSKRMYRKDSDFSINDFFEV